MELIMAFVVAISIAIAIFRFFPEISTLLHSTESSALIHFLEELFYIIIAIEFLKMLCKPNADTIIEVLIFLEARHMIIGETTSAQDLLSIICIVMLFLLQIFLQRMKVPKKDSWFFMNLFWEKFKCFQKKDISGPFSWVFSEEPALTGNLKIPIPDTVLPRLLQHLQIT